MRLPNILGNAPANFSIMRLFDLRHGTPSLPLSPSLHPRALLTTRHCAYFILHLHPPQHSNLISKPDTMRYQDWDILLYPKDCEVPFKEFKTTPYAVQEGGGGSGMFASFTALNDFPDSDWVD